MVTCSLPFLPGGRCHEFYSWVRVRSRTSYCRSVFIYLPSCSCALSNSDGRNRFHRRGISDLHTRYAPRTLMSAAGSYCQPSDWDAPDFCNQPINRTRVVGSVFRKYGLPWDKRTSRRPAVFEWSSKVSDICSRFVVWASSSVERAGLPLYFHPPRVKLFSVSLQISDGTPRERGS